MILKESNVVDTSLLTPKPLVVTNQGLYIFTQNKDFYTKITIHKSFNRPHNK